MWRSHARLAGADTVVLDPLNGDPLETSHPQAAWQALATVAAHQDPATVHKGSER